jgi:hypothetical protein
VESATRPYLTTGELHKLTGAPDWMLRRSLDRLASEGVQVLRVAAGCRLLPVSAISRLREELARRGHACPEVAGA